MRRNVTKPILIALVILMQGIASVRGEKDASGHDPNTIYPVDSKIFDGAGYHPQKRTLVLVFDSGYMYEYYNVPSGIFRGFMKSYKKGRYFNENIRREFSYGKIPIRTRSGASKRAHCP